MKIDKQVPILRAISIIGGEKLTPIKKKLGDDFSYEEIRLVRASLISDRNKFEQAPDQNI